MKRTATNLTILLVFCAIAHSGWAQSVETVVTSPLVADYLALDKATGDLYTSNYEKVSRISPDGTIRTLAEGYTLVTGLGISEAGNLYYADTVTNIIYKRSRAGNISRLVTSLVDPIGLWISANNDGFYTQTQAGSVYFVTFGGAVTELYSGLGGRITDITLDAAGNIYLAYFDTGLIKRITPDGTVSDFATIPGWISYITYGGGSLYATGWQSHQVYRIDPATAAVEVIAGTGDAGLVDGEALTEAQFNIPNGLVTSVTGDTLYVSDFQTSSLRRIILTTATDVEETTEKPEAFALAQNYPNPFNPVTSIPFSLRTTSYVTLTVFDVHGKRMGTLLSQLRPPGEHAVTWDARDYPSGVYLYRLETADHVQTRRMVLLK